jgi:hypothetical protein
MIKELFPIFNISFEIGKLFVYSVRVVKKGLILRGILV